MLLFLNVIYVLIAIAMIALILMQRGAGAQAGSGFGGGASGTVFGSRGASNFLSKSTKWLAISFFSISLFMAWHATQSSNGAQTAADLGLMSQVPGSPVPTAPAARQAVPSAPASAAVAVPTQIVPPGVPAAGSSAPSVPADNAPSQSPPQQVVPAQSPTGN